MSKLPETCVSSPTMQNQRSYFRCDSQHIQSALILLLNLFWPASWLRFDHPINWQWLQKIEQNHNIFCSEKDFRRARCSENVIRMILIHFSDKKCHCWWRGNIFDICLTETNNPTSPVHLIHSWVPNFVNIWQFCDKTIFTATIKTTL